jgi:hypothetical protein
VIAVLTKYEALVNRMNDEYEERNVAKNKALNYAKMSIFDPLKNVIHVPAAIVRTQCESHYYYNKNKNIKVL